MKAFQLTSTQRTIIEDTLSILRNPETWTTHIAARNSSGEPVDIKSPEATRWCFYGAIMKSDPSPLRRMSPDSTKIFNILKHIAYTHKDTGQGASLVEVNESARYGIKNSEGIVVQKREAAIRVCELALELDTSQATTA